MNATIMASPVRIRAGLFMLPPCVKESLYPSILLS
jgi:hypothetical protein